MHRNRVQLSKAGKSCLPAQPLLSGNHFNNPVLLHWLLIFVFPVDLFPAISIIIFQKSEYLETALNSTRRAYSRSTGVDWWMMESKLIDKRGLQKSENIFSPTYGKKCIEMQPLAFALSLYPRIYDQSIWSVDAHT